jgi:hypothetical protein
MLSSAREALIEEVEPALTWRYGPAVRLWPFLLPAAISFLLCFIFLVVTNHNSTTCNDQLHYDHWVPPPPAEQVKWDIWQHKPPTNCEVLESATGTWTSLLATLPEQVHSIFSPAQQTTAWELSERLYAPSTEAECYIKEPPTGWTSHFQFLPISDGNFLLFVDTDVVMDPPIHIQVRAYVPTHWKPYLQQGSFTLEDLNYTDVPGGQLPQRPRILNSTFTSRAAENNSVIIFWPMTPRLLRLTIATACMQFIAAKHIMSCTSCEGDSWATILWIIVLGSIQAVTLIASCAKWCLQKHNRRNQLRPRDANYAEPLLKDERDESEGEAAPVIALQQ